MNDIDLQIVVWRLEENLQHCRAKIDRLVRLVDEKRSDIEKLRHALLTLDKGGGLGLDKHNAIREALGLSKDGR
jgi:hypothetical protein